MSRAPSSGTPTLDKSGETIRDMFAGVAPRYDLLNRLMTGFLDVSWRRTTVRLLDPRPGDRVLDLCCGTGDQALELRKRGAEVVAADFCLPMLALAQPKLGGGGSPRLAAADALVLPFASDRFDGATVSFGLRNVADLDRSLAELARVLKPGGRLAVLEATQPTGPVFARLHRVYSARVLPLLGRLLSPRSSAYEYLPDSVVSFPQRRDFLDRMEGAGFAACAFRELAGGTVCVYTGTVDRRGPGGRPS